MVRTVAAISFGAIAGALSRYYLGLYLGQLFGTQLPYGTLIINVTGCFVMGVMTAVPLRHVVTIHPDLRLLLLTGFLGSYTTFSSYALDSVNLLQQQLDADLFYWAGSAFLGLLSLELGIVLAERVLNQVGRKRSG
jgi:fluoride exporter